MRIPASLWQDYCKLLEEYDSQEKELELVRAARALLQKERAEAERNANEKLRQLGEERIAAEESFKKRLEDDRMAAEKD